MTSSLCAAKGRQSTMRAGERDNMIAKQSLNMSAALTWLLVFAIATRAGGASDAADDREARAELDPNLSEITSPAKAEDETSQLRELSTSLSKYQSLMKNVADKLPDWETYKKIFNKSYRSLSEQLVRLKLFIARSLKATRTFFAFKHEKSDYFTTVNQFSDKTRSERAKVFLDLSDGNDGQHHHRNGLRRVRSKRSLAAPDRDKSGGDILAKVYDMLAPLKQQLQAQRSAEPTYVNWQKQTKNRRKPCLMEPTFDQQDCGCCYAAASMRLFEWLLCEKRAALSSSSALKKIKLSEQFLVNCGSMFDLDGCTKGNLVGVMRFVYTIGLLPSEQMPYVAHERDECPAKQPGHIERHFRADLVKVKDVNYKLLEQSHEWPAELAQQPLVVLANLDDDLLDYGGGIYRPGSCQPESAHFMLLVGFKLNKATGDKVWLFSNSFGPDWGEWGYLRMSNDKAPAGCFAYAVKVDAQFQ